MAICFQNPHHLVLLVIVIVTANLTILSSFPYETFITTCDHIHVSLVPDGMQSKKSSHE